MTSRRQFLNAYTPNEKSSVIVASTYSSGGMPVVWCHGANADLTQATENAQARVDLEYMARRGYVVCMTDLGGAATWGNDAGLASIDGQITWMGTAFGAATGKVVLIADSHGACVALNWAVRNPTRVAAVVARVPAVALQAFHDRSPAFAGGIETAYGGLAALIAAYPTRDPSHPTFAALIRSSGLSDRIRCYYNTDDPIILASEVIAFGRAAAVETVDFGGGGHAPWPRVNAIEQYRWIRKRL